MKLTLKYPLGEFNKHINGNAVEHLRSSVVPGGSLSLEGVTQRNCYSSLGLLSISTVLIISKVAVWNETRGMTLPFALPFISARPLGTAVAGVLEITLNAYLLVYHPHTDAQKHIEDSHDGACALLWQIYTKTVIRLVYRFTLRTRSFSLMVTNHPPV